MIMVLRHDSHKFMLAVIECQLYQTLVLGRFALYERFLDIRETGKLEQ